MGHGKETPRQKMIGMMYLVLTAMLALNVSADLLNAFSLVDSGLSRTTKSYASKNEKTFNRFKEAELLNPIKVGPHRENAERIHEKAKAIYAYVNGLKVEIVSKADGKDSQALLADGEVDSRMLDNKTNTDIPAQVMILDKGGAKLKAMLVDFRETILSLLDKEKDAQQYEAISQMLDTQDPPPASDGQQYTWESYRFEHIPIIAVLPQLTKVQVDVLNAEAEAMSLLLTRIDAGDFKFNQIGAVVIPSSDYIMRGSEFKAKIFLAASDTTQRPKVFVGPYDSTYNEGTHEWVYAMLPGHERDTVPVMPNGVGMLSRQATANGVVHWGGLIEIQGLDGTVIRKPFKHAYTVAEPSLAVSPSKMNVLYLGVLNPIDISVSGVAMEKVSVSMRGGTISRQGNSYVARPNSGVNSCDIVVVADGKQMGVKKFRVKKVPDPLPTIFGLNPKQTLIDKGELITAQGVQAKMPDDFDFDLSFKVLGFKVGVTAGGYYSESSSDGPRFSQAQKALMKSLVSNQVVTITDIRVQGPDGTRTLQPKVYKVR